MEVCSGAVSGCDLSRYSVNAGMKKEITIAFTDNPRTRPIRERRVQAEGIAFLPSVVNPGEMFWRQLHYGDWDVAEMSFSTLMIAHAVGDDRFVGLPIFTTRRFFHSHILVRKASGIKTPQDLKGRRVGVTEYQQTGALWTRGALEHEWGVRSQDMEFFMERTPDKSHGGSTGFVPPPGVTVHQIPAEKSVASMMLSGELDAAIHYRGWASLVNRSHVNLRAHADIATLFPDVAAEGARYYAKTGILPINHGMVIKRELAERHPWVIINILKAFNEANRICEAERMEHVDYHIDTGLLPPNAREALATQLVHHGIPHNRKTLETAARYSFEQGLTPRLVRLDEVFAANAMDI